LNAGRLLHARGDNDEAEAYFAAALRLRPRDARTLRNASALRADQGRIGEAIELLRNSITLEPNHARARARLEELLTLRDQVATPPSDIAK
jgi:tetratricopeptide (TPR) repeat protein